MSLVIRAGPPEHHRFFAERMNLYWTPGFRTVEAFDTERGVPVAAAGYDHWTENGCEMHTWVDDPRVFFKRETLFAVFDYVFNQCGKGVVWTMTAAFNQKSIRFTKGLGFKLHAIIEDGWSPGVPMFMFTLRKEDCRFLKQPARKAA